MKNIIFIILILALYFSVSSTEGLTAELRGTVDVDMLYKNLSAGEDIEYNNKIIKGDLDLDRYYSAQFDGNSSVPCPRKIVIQDSVVDGNITCNNIIFLKAVEFINTTFIKDVCFCSSNFNDTVDFSQSKFRGFQAIFMGDTFMGSVNFKSTNFTGDDTQFVGSDFMSNVQFNDAIFKGGSVSFENSEFRDKTEFTNARFVVYNETKFGGSTFYKDAEFWYVNFKNAELKKVTFAGDAYFGGCIFEGDADFSMSQFEKEAFFRNTTFHNDINIKGAQFRRNAFFEKANLSDVSKIDLEDDTHFDKLYARWSTIENRISYDEDIYLYLIDNYKRLGWSMDADSCYYSYRDGYRENTYTITNGNNLFMTYFAKTIDWFSMIIYGYGVKPERPLTLIPLIILAFSLFFREIDHISSIDALSFSTTVFLSGTGRLFVETPSYEPALKNSRTVKSLSRIMFYFERILGLIIFAALIITISNTILRT
jgi:uncharacterized protein YjbI with pentapeptide repeats